jgi:hypothetical protein
MRRFLFALVVACCALAAPPAQAQLRFTSSPPDCNLARKAFDNYIGDGHAGGFTVRRYQHHLIGAGISTVTAIGLRKVLHLPNWATASIAVAGVGVVPHVRGYLRGTYDINARDWIADAWIRSAPAWYAIGHGGHDAKSHVLAATTYIAGYFAVACYASP